MKQHTIIVVPHTRAKFRKWRFTTLQVSLVLATFLLLTVTGIFATVSFFSQSVDRDQLVRIQAENESLREINQGFEGSIQELQDQLVDYQQRIHKLAIVAGLAELAPNSDVGIGGVEMDELPEPALSTTLQRLHTEVSGLGDDMLALDRKLQERQLLIASTPAISPVKGLMTSGFGYRKDPFTGRRAFHAGLDIVARPGKEIQASGDGIVTHAGRLRGLGISVYVSHGRGIVTRYGHLSRLGVKLGQRVKRGDVVGYLGNTGRSTGYHLHYEVRVNGKPTNPLAYILDDVGP